MLGGQINKSPVSNFLMMLCAKNYCRPTLLIFGRVIFKIQNGAFFETECIYLHNCPYAASAALSSQAEPAYGL